MDTSSEWQKSLSFSDRMATTLKIATSYKTAFPETDTSNTQVEARQIESSIYKSASSKENYHQRCDAKIDEFSHLNQVSDDEPYLEPDGTDPEDPQTGESIGPYENCTYLTNGPFSTIYKTRTTNPPQTLALKLTTPSQSQPPHDPKREARILASLSHPNIIPLLSTHSLPTTPSSLLLVFPFQHLDLSSLIQKHNPLTQKQQANTIKDIFAGLSHLHSKNIIHRDIKPTNILLSTPHGPALLADFGTAWAPPSLSLSSSSAEPPEQKITDVGTTCYRAPELLFGKRDYGCEIDLWAAGCVVAEIVMAGQKPQPGIKKEEQEGGWTLFNAGALGSELALVKSIFETLGTPNSSTWPETTHLPDWGKMTFVQFPSKTWEDILPGVEVEARDLVGKLVRYQSSERISAEEVLKHAFLSERGV
ncbi:hypothetical protein JMJ35_002960 [Cladonia borealis]|uniref:cyclin-dependent kinase n=1 Tax=Cladonia borealis TaxID=184061 RepID=A0AA39R6R0_9LECA|nr:hypothetical protein JMJ35_002960 [Cladonia borealis]